MAAMTREPNIHLALHTSNTMRRKKGREQMNCVQLSRTILGCLIWETQNQTIQLHLQQHFSSLCMESGHSSPTHDHNTKPSKLSLNEDCTLSAQLFRSFRRWCWMRPLLEQLKADVCERTRRMLWADEEERPFRDRWNGRDRLRRDGKKREHEPWFWSMDDYFLWIPTNILMWGRDGVASKFCMRSTACNKCWPNQTPVKVKLSKIAISGFCHWCLSQFFQRDLGLGRILKMVNE